MSVDNDQMKKRMKIMLLCVGILFGSIFLYKIVMGLVFSYFVGKNRSPIVTVSTTVVSYAMWQPELYASGSTRAIQGVNVTTQLGGMVEKIYFTPGATVKQGDLLVQLNANSDIGQLQALQASEELAKITYKRDKLQYAAKAISKETLDTDAANVKNFQGQVDAQAATVAKKTILAPFSGRLGVSEINEGQYLNPGDAVVTLQQLDPI
ncbi:MAG TPA: efflux RND transporter periplasmic adaptor subunit, partial [Gammaproteobacteria bacterium]|nr:efflux RND transporter periplasmic adaptor subunit [Gammaproteobacteria bacterium]